MLSAVMKKYQLAKEFQDAGYYETASIKQLLSDLQTVISTGKILVLTGIIGCGKTLEALELLSTKLKTPLQIQSHLSKAFEKAYQRGEPRLTAAMIRASQR